MLIFFLCFLCFGLFPSFGHLFSMGCAQSLTFESGDFFLSFSLSKAGGSGDDNCESNFGMKDFDKLSGTVSPTQTQSERKPARIGNSGYKAFLLAGCYNQKLQVAYSIQSRRKTKCCSKELLSNVSFLFAVFCVLIETVFFFKFSEPFFKTQSRSAFFYTAVRFFHAAIVFGAFLFIHCASVSLISSELRKDSPDRFKVMY